MTILVVAFLLGVGVQFLQIRLTAWIVKRKRPGTTVLTLALKALLWTGLVAGTLYFSPRTLISGIAGSVVFTLSYAIAHFVAMRKEE